MSHIELSGTEIADIILALLADEFSGERHISVSAIASRWKALGLRQDDLIQGISALSRAGSLEAEGEGADNALALKDATLAMLANSGIGLKQLPEKLQNALQLAASRNTSDDPANAGERRKGFK